MPRSSSAMGSLTNSNELKYRDDKYRQINAELEAKTAQLMKEADDIIEYSSNIVGNNPAQSVDEHNLDLNISLCQLSKYETPNDVETIIIPDLPVNASQDPSASGSDRSDHRQGLYLDQNGDVELTNTKMRINDDQIMPVQAAGLSLNAQNRYLKAKVKVLLEENQKLYSELSNRTAETDRLKSRLQELEEERNRLHRVTTTHSTQLEKVKKSLGEARTQCDTLEAEKNSFKKDGDSFKRTIDQQTSEIKTLSTRLNRALEDAERYKLELEKVRASTRENADSIRRNVEQLTSENRRLERQKSDLISAFKKQMKLIDVLRRQKMLIEASKCLQITEEEFLKSLDWQK